MSWTSPSFSPELRLQTGLTRCTGFVLSFQFLCETEKTKPESHVQAFNPVDHVNPVSVLCLCGPVRRSFQRRRVRDSAVSPAFLTRPHTQYYVCRLLTRRHPWVSLRMWLGLRGRAELFWQSFSSRWVFSCLVFGSLYSLWEALCSYLRHLSDTDPERDSC